MDRVQQLQHARRRIQHRADVRLDRDHHAALLAVAHQRADPLDHQRLQLIPLLGCAADGGVDRRRRAILRPVDRQIDSGGQARPVQRGRVGVALDHVRVAGDRRQRQVMILQHARDPPALGGVEHAERGGVAGMTVSSIPS